MKERLTGAIILVAVLVLLVPELLSGPERTTPGPTSDTQNGAALRSYTIDLAEGSSARRATVPSTTVVEDDPVGAATPEAEDFEVSRPGTADSSPASEGATGSGAVASTGGGPAATGTDSSATRSDTDARPSGSGADVAAATPGAPASPTEEERKPSQVASADDDKPRSAFGPNARQRPATPSGSASTTAAPRSKESETPRPSTASGAKASSGWGVQLGVFASRENADRLARQVKGKGYTVSVNELPKSGKRLYRVRVGPEATRPGAVELSAKLRAAGHQGTVVAWP